MTNEKRCGTCRHWRAPDAISRGRGIAHGWCGRLPANDECDPNEECAAATAFTEDVERYHSTLRTLPAFGCVLHEATTVNGGE